MQVNDGSAMASGMFHIGKQHMHDATIRVVYKGIFFFQRSQKTSPVSYTHLDVYKRQLICSSQHPLFSEHNRPSLR